MFFMRMSLDIVFCDADMEIVRIVHRAPPVAHWPALQACALRPRDRPGEAARLGLREGMALHVEPAF